MRHNGIPAPRFAQRGLLLFLLLTLGCFAACAIPKKTPVMAKLEGVDVTAEQLRLKVADFVLVFGGLVERGADEILENSQSPKAREAALQWKSNAIPACQGAAFQFDPLIGLLDLWAFSLQMEDFFTTGNGKSLFGKEQFVARRVSKNFQEEVTRFLESFAPSYNLEKAKSFVEVWVKKNPIDNLLFIRRSTNMSLAAYNEDKSLGSVLGGIDERMTDMTTRMNVIMQQMPKIGRWQGQLFIADQVNRPAVEMFNTKQISKDLQPAMKSFEKIADLAPQLPAFIEQQRVALKQDVESLTRQILNDVQTRTQATIQETEAKSKALIDYVFVRLIQLVLILAVIGMLFVFLIKRKKTMVVKA